ncbi:MAG: RNA polymerase-associated protein RapA [Bacteroidia bacterium]
MDNYFPQQRYTSKGEPELGVGIVQETSKGKVKIFFPQAKETRLYATESAPLHRLVFKPGDIIKDADGNDFKVIDLELIDDLYVYYGNDEQLSEADLGDVSAQNSVVDRLLSGEVDAPKDFALRRESLQHEYHRRVSAVNGFVGGRIDLVPHQLYIANEVSDRFAPRVLLSDQVGLGKTIEACLILHRLLLSGRISRVLILVPESLVHQWFVEVLRRFNMWFNIFDEERCAALEEGAPDGNPFLDNQLVLCSTEFMAASAKRTKQAITAEWDMLVVDEAHNLKWSVKETSPEYSVVELLSKVAKGLLLLTATPEQLGVESHFARLRLLDPNRYANYNTFVNENHQHGHVADLVEKLDTGKKLSAKDNKLLSEYFDKERIIAATNDDTKRENLIEDLLDQHGPGRVLFRNTRAAMKGFPKRKVHLYPLNAAAEQEIWQERMQKEFERDLDPTPTKRAPKYWFDEDPRVAWLIETIKSLESEKVLLICKTKAKVLALEKVLSERENIKAGIFHEELTIVQRDRNAAWFAEADGAQVLLCSEIGSEGRNFQFAHHLVLFDLPQHPELLEQRIGRLDRIGQTEDIHIHVPYLEQSPQEVLAHWYHKGLNAFEENLEGGNQFFERFGKEVLALAQNPKPEKEALEKVIEETSAYQAALKQKLAEGRDRLLEMNSFRPKKAEKLINQIQQEDNNTRLEKYLTRVFNHYGIDMEDLAKRTYFLKSSSVLAGVFPAIPRQGLWATFDRQKALSREDIAFLSWDHPICTDAIDTVLSSELGNASFGILKGGGAPGLFLELLFILETPSAQNLGINRFMPNTPIRIVVDHTGEEVTDNYPEELLNKQLVRAQIEPLLDNEALVENVIPAMVAAATEIANQQGVLEKAKGLRKMTTQLNHEIDRLQRLQEKNNNIRPEEIEIAQKEQSVLKNVIGDARVRLDAVQLVMVQ